MSECLTCDKIPLPASHGLGEIKKLNRIVSNNYGVIFLSLISVIILSFIFKHYGGIVYKEIKNYTDMVEDVKKQKDSDDYYYDDELDALVDIREYLPKGKKKYIKKINNIYDEYNSLKSDYIKRSRRKDNDDVIDKNIMYKKHDNYEYE